jgi:hypothetical protein
VVVIGNKDSGHSIPRSIMLCDARRFNPRRRFSVQTQLNENRASH